MLIVIYPVLSEEINLISHILHIFEVGAKIVLKQLDVQILHSNHLGSVVNDHMGIHDLKCHHEEDQATRDLPPRAIIYVDELALIGLKIVVSCPGDIILQDEVDFPADLPETYLV